MNKPLQPMLTVTQVAELLQMSAVRVRQLVRTGAIRSVKPSGRRGGTWRVPQSEVDRLCGGADDPVRLSLPDRERLAQAALASAGLLPSGTPARTRRGRKGDKQL